ncbi:MAG: NosD domain-containing protein [Candidatus Bathyarchaeia archaeon]
MRQKTLPKTFLTFMILASAFAYALSTTISSSGKSISSNEIRVGSGESIQEAINNANPGDTIIVSQGTYKQWDIVVNKTLKIVGENPENTILDGNGTAQYIFHVIANNVFIGNFTLKGMNPDPNTYSYALGIANTLNVTAKNLIITDTVIGIDVQSSNFSKVLNNQFRECKGWALRLHKAGCNNTIVSNNFENNTIAITFADASSKFNKIYHNNFINNTRNVVSYSINYFDNGYPSGGNYWSNHTKTDLKHGVYQNESGSDGIVDEVYYEWGATDNYPLVYPLTILKIIVDEKIFEIEVSTNSSLNSYTFNFEMKSLKLFLMGGEDAVGACRISIPKELLSCDQLSQWNITLSSNGQLSFLEYLALEDAETTYLYFTYNQSDSFEIEVIGINAVPEFPSIASIIILLVAATAIILFKSKFSKKR